jgi:hypothetical protein
MIPMLVNFEIWQWRLNRRRGAERRERGNSIVSVQLEFREKAMKILWVKTRKLVTKLHADGMPVIRLKIEMVEQIPRTIANRWQPVVSQVTFKKGAEQ